MMETHQPPYPMSDVQCMMCPALVSVEAMHVVTEQFKRLRSAQLAKLVEWYGEDATLTVCAHDFNVLLGMVNTALVATSPVLSTAIEQPTGDVE